MYTWAVVLIMTQLQFTNWLPKMDASKFHYVFGKLEHSLQNPLRYLTPDVLLLSQAQYQLRKQWLIHFVKSSAKQIVIDRCKYSWVTHGSVRTKPNMHRFLH